MSFVFNQREREGDLFQQQRLICPARPAVSFVKDEKGNTMANVGR